MDLAGPASLTDVVLPSLVNDLAALPQRLVLALDDYHVIANPRVHEAVTFLLDHLPDTLELAVATRSEPPLPLGRLRVRSELVEVARERAALHRRRGGDAAERHARARARRGRHRAPPATGPRAGPRVFSWPRCRCPAARTPRAFISLVCGRRPPVVDYLGFEVLDGQPRRCASSCCARRFSTGCAARCATRVTDADDSARR